MDSRAKIIIVDDNLMFRQVIKHLVEIEEIGEVIAEAENGQVFLDLLEKFTPDLVLMDIEMPVMGGLEATVKALAIKPDLKILVLTLLMDKDNFDNLKNAGALGFALKTCGKKELEKAIKAVIIGENYFPDRLSYSKA